MYTNSMGWSAPAQTEVALVDFGTKVKATVTPAPPGGPMPITFPTPVSIPITAGTKLGGIGNSNFGSFNAAMRAVPVTFPGDQATITFNGGTITVIFRNPNSGRFDYAQIFLPTPPPIVLNDLSAVAQTNFIWAFGCDDPRMKPINYMWTPETSAQITLGGANARGVVTFNGAATVTNTAGGTSYNLQKDGDMSCHIVSSDTLRGKMSPGEMAYIHVGPWRTFWLQPEPSGETTFAGGALIPDWAVVDLFSERATTNVTVSGLMNINAGIRSLNSGPGSSLSPVFPPRLAPLYALLTNGLGSYPNYVQATAANNIYNMVYDGADPNSLFNNIPTGMFSYGGQVCEIKGLSKNTSNNKSLAETPARGIVNLITPRSDIFTIWAIGQSIKDVNRNGTFEPGVDIITGEARAQVIVQRYEDPAGAAKFRTLYYRFVGQ
jgi:hypothetical protein